MRKLWMEEITKLKQQPDKDIIIHGSASLVQSLRGTGLHDNRRPLLTSHIPDRAHGRDPTRFDATDTRD